MTSEFALVEVMLIDLGSIAVGILLLARHLITLPVRSLSISVGPFLKLDTWNIGVVDDISLLTFLQS